MFSLIKPGGWAFGEILTSAQMNALDTDHANAVDGLNGGLYTLTAPLSVGGNAVTIDVLGCIDLTASGNVLGALGSFGDLSSTGNLACAGDLNVEGSSTLGDSAADAVTVNATTTFNSPVTLNDTVTCGSVNINGNTMIGNASSDTLTTNAKLISPLVLNGAGRVRRRVSPGADSNSSYGPKDWDVVRIGLTLASNRDYTIDDTGAANDDEIEFSLRSGPQTVTVKAPGGSTLQLLDTGGSVDWVRCVRVSGSWVALYRGKT